MIALGVQLAGCTPPEVDPIAPSNNSNTIKVADLWDGRVEVDTRTTVSPLVVISPRTTDGLRFYASSASGGPRSGLEIVLGAVIDDWPPPVGTAFIAEGILIDDDPPSLWVSNSSGLLAPEEDGRPLVLTPQITDLAEIDPLDRDDLRNGLVLARDIRVTSTPDPLGRADSTSVPLAGRFGTAPGYNRTGDLVGIWDAEGRLSPRFVSDWSGEWPSDPPQPADLGSLDGLPSGTPVSLPDLIVATPWSRDRRWAVLQDAAGRGAWLDTEGWGLWASVEPGQIGTWAVEIRQTPEGRVLRTWVPPLLEDLPPRAPILTDAIEDGAIVPFAAADLGPPDAYGERTTDGPTLDDRFTDLSSLPEGGTASGTAAVRLPPDAAPHWLAPLSLDP